jgi:arginyl-tRNA synthetase
MGPAQQALAEILGDAGRAVEAVRRSPLGEYRVDLAALDPAASIDDLRARGEALCRDLAAHPSVERAANVAPRVYIRLTTSALWDAVLYRAEVPVPEREPVLLTFSDPNTNKPLHIGHLRNLFLGSALASLHEASGHPVRREGTFGDWGVHICEALVSYLAAGAPVAAATKPDHFVGGFYAEYHQEARGPEDDTARRLLVELDAGRGPRDDHDRLTAWARIGIEQTYERLGLSFDGLYSEAAHLSSARKLVDTAVGNGRLVRRDDGCVVIPRHDDDGGDIVIVRPDGTLLVYPQILGIDVDRFAGWTHRILSVFGHQWESGVGDLLTLARAADMPWVDRYEPLFYGMVRLPSGSMRSREGNAVGADETIDALVDQTGSEDVAVGVLRYHLLRQARMKTVMFDPAVVVAKTLPAYQRAKALAALAAGPVDGSAPAPGAKREAAMRRVLLAIDGVSEALENALVRRDPAVALQYLEELVRCTGELSESSSLDPLRTAAGKAAARVLAAVDDKARLGAPA